MSTLISARAPFMIRAAGARARASVPAAVAFALVYGPLVAVIAALGMLRAEQAVGGRFAVVTAVVLGASVAAGLAAWLLAAAVAGQMRWSARFSAMLVTLLGGTAGMIAAAQFIAFATADVDRDPSIGFPSLHWAFSQLGGIAMAGYITLAAGLRLLLPAGLVPLFAGAFLFAWTTRRRRG